MSPIPDQADVLGPASARDQIPGAREPALNLERGVAEEQQPLRVGLLLRREAVLARHEEVREPPKVSHRRWIPAAIAILLVLGAGAAGYLSGSSGGRDVEAARRAGAAAGEDKGAAQGAKEGYARGLETGRKHGYQEAYPDAYRTAYLDQFRDAGLGAPETVSVPQP